MSVHLKYQFKGELGRPLLPWLDITLFSISLTENRLDFRRLFISIQKRGIDSHDICFLHHSAHKRMTGLNQSNIHIAFIQQIWFRKLAVLLNLIQLKSNAIGDLSSRLAEAKLTHQCKPVFTSSFLTKIF